MIVSNIRYDYNGIDQCAELIDGFLRKMDSELDGIETALKPLEGDAWRGSVAQEVYFEKKTEWRNAALKIAESLMNLKVSLGVSKEGMQSADIRAAGMFG